MGAYKNLKGIREANGSPSFGRDKSMVIDHVLITALVERWRPETNLFHFPSGEATIILDDVAYIYNLPIDGPRVTGRTFPGRLLQPIY